MVRFRAISAVKLLPLRTLRFTKEFVVFLRVLVEMSHAIGADARLFRAKGLHWSNGGRLPGRQETGCQSDHDDCKKCASERDWIPGLEPKQQ